MSEEFNDDPVDDGLSNLWPLDVALGGLGAFALVFVVQYLSFTDERWQYNAWTYVIGIITGVVLLDVVLRKIAGRFVQRSMQLGFIVSILVHLGFLTMALQVVFFTQAWPVPQAGKKEEAPRPRKQVSERFVHSTVASSQKRFDWQMPVESLHESRELPSPERMENTKIETAPALEAPEQPNIEIKPREQELAPRKQLSTPEPQPSQESRRLDRQAAPENDARPMAQKADVPQLPAAKMEDAIPELRTTEIDPSRATPGTAMAPLRNAPGPKLDLNATAPQRANSAAPAGDIPQVASVQRNLNRSPNAAPGQPNVSRVTVPQVANSAASQGMQAVEASPAMRESSTGRFSPSAGANVPLASSAPAMAPSGSPGAAGNSSGAPSSYARSGRSGAGDGPQVAESGVGSPFARKSPVLSGSAGGFPSAGTVAAVPVPGLASSGGGSNAEEAGVPEPGTGLDIGRGRDTRSGGATPSMAGAFELSANGLQGSYGPSVSGRSQNPGTGDRPDPLAVARSESLSRRKFEAPSAGKEPPRAAIPFQRRLMRTAGGGSPDDPGQAGPQTEEAIELGLKYLASCQNSDGSWSLQAVDPGVIIHSDTAATGLCILAFQGAGYTHRQHQYARTVDRALNWMLAHQGEDGDLYKTEDDASNRNVWLYSHGVASLALCEAYGMTQDSRLMEPAQKALNFIAKAQHTTRGGWRYQPQESADTSVSGWMVMALKSGELSGLRVDPATYEGVRRWLELSRDASNRPYLYRYNPYAPDTETQRHGRDVTPSMTAVGLLMQMYLGWRRENVNLQKGADYLLQYVPSHGSPGRSQRDLYYWYYATQVMFHMGGDHWRKWNETLNPLLIKSQVKEGKNAGSWAPNEPVPDRWGNHAGRLYVTTMHLLNLEVYYRHLPIYEETAR